jgi:hypothetical protein
MKPLLKFFQHPPIYLPAPTRPSAYGFTPDASANTPHAKGFLASIRMILIENPHIDVMLEGGMQNASRNDAADED